VPVRSAAWALPSATSGPWRLPGAVVARARAERHLGTVEPCRCTVETTRAERHLGAVELAQCAANATHAEHHLGTGELARHLGPWRSPGVWWRPGPVPSTTSNLGALPVRGGGQGQYRAPPRGRGAGPVRSDYRARFFRASGSMLAATHVSVRTEHALRTDASRTRRRIRVLCTCAG